MAEIVIVDSSVWIDYLRGNGNAEAYWLRDALGEKDICLTDLNLCEVLAGYKSESEAANARNRLEGFGIMSTGGAELAVAAAFNYRLLRSKGITIRSTPDYIIATYCIQHNYTLLHRDRDFDHFEKLLGLRVVRLNG